MKTSEITVTVLESSQGEYLTQTALKEGEERVFITKAFLAQGSTAEEWRTATAAEKEEYEAEREKELNNENSI